ncbi:MAG: DUF4331 family protein [Dehalococcoidia bacterium]
MRLRKATLALGAAAVAVGSFGAIPALGADHRDAPLAQGSPALDINDLYAFTANGGNLVVAMTVNPLTSPSGTAGLKLDPDATYILKFDLNGDAVADIAGKIWVSGSGAVQDISWGDAVNANAVSHDRSIDTPHPAGKTSAGSAVTTVSNAAGGKLYIGPRDDPFFFDLAGFQNGLKFTGVDTFKGTNVTAIVVEIPKAVIAAAAPSGQVGVWAATTKKNAAGTWEQIDRMGRPAINTVFIPADQKDAFNSNNPDRDAAIYTDEVKAALDSLASPATDALAGILLPDILTVDVTKPVAYLNGRGLADDVIDISLQAITGSTTIGDGVNANDKPFGAAFPYLATPHGATAPGAPNTGSGLEQVSGEDSSFGWTLPAGLIAAGALLAAAGVVQRRRPIGEGS